MRPYTVCLVVHEIVKEDQAAIFAVGQRAHCACLKEHLVGKNESPTMVVVAHFCTKAVSAADSVHVVADFALQTETQSAVDLMSCHESADS